jgi:hypothetical protein
MSIGVEHTTTAKTIHQRAIVVAEAVELIVTVVEEAITEERVEVASEVLVVNLGGELEVNTEMAEVNSEVVEVLVPENKDPIDSQNNKYTFIF